MQMRADQRSTGVGVDLKWTKCLCLCRDRIIDDVVWNDAKRVENTLCPIDMAHVHDSRGVSIVWLTPVELLLCMDNHGEDRLGLSVNVDQLSLGHKFSPIISE